MCTQQLQKWHRRTGSHSIPMVPLQELKPTSAKRKKTIKPADPKNEYFKRDVTNIVQTLSKQLDKEKPVEMHVHSVLKPSNVGRKSAVGQLLQNRYDTIEMAVSKNADYIDEKTRRIMNYTERETRMEEDLPHVDLKNFEIK